MSANITGMMHESGTGGAPKYGVIPQMPLTSIEAHVNLLDNQTYAQPRVSFFFCLICFTVTATQDGFG